MASLREIRKRISGVRNTMQLTRAMKMVSAAKLRRAHDRVEGSRSYYRLLREMTERVVASSRNDDCAVQLSPISGAGHACLVFASDRGLCGSYNNAVAKGAFDFYQQNPECRFMVFGKKAMDAFRRKDVPVFFSKRDLYTALSWEHAVATAEEIFALCRKESIGKLSVVYTKFVSAGRQVVTCETLFPFAVDESTATDGASTGDMMLVEPEKASVLTTLVDYVSRFSFYFVILEVLASEHAARMAAMDNASRNCKEIIDNLTLEMNRARQSTITRELLEIIGGKEALEG